MIITWKIAAVSLKHILEITPHRHTHPRIQKKKSLKTLIEDADSLVRQLPTYDFLLKNCTLKVLIYNNFLYCLLMITDLDQPNITSTDNRPVEGSDVTLSCTVDGQPTPAISWTMNGSPLNTSGDSRISFTEDDLTIANVNRTDSGEYHCVAENSLRNVSSTASTLSVQCEKPFCLSGLFS